jgi:hypothetical protein
VLPTARAECYLYSHSNPLAEASGLVAGLREEAGADVVFLSAARSIADDGDFSGLAQAATFDKLNGLFES